MKRAYAPLPALFLVAAIAGCHRHSKSSAPPPPPAVSHAAPTRRSPRPATEDRRSRQDRSTESSSGDPWHGRPLATQVGLASWYGPPYAGRKGADGTVYDQNAMTAAHLTFPLGTVVRVTNLSNNESVVVRITDRGPFVRGRIIDLSLAAAKATGVYRAGVVKVRVDAFSMPPPRPDALPGGRWCVQVGGFSNGADALQEKADLLRRYPGARVIEFAGPTGFWVRITPKLADRQHADEVAESIHLPDAAQPYLTRTD